jgi:PAS domain S-box-containing protein
MSRVSDACSQFALLRRQLDLVDAGARTFSDLFDHAPEPMVVIDGKGRVIATTAAACRLFGVDRSELVGMQVQDLLPRELDLRGASRRLRDFGEASLEFRDVTKDGSLIDVRLEGRLFQPGRYLISFRDVTSERRHERERPEHRTFGEVAATIVHHVNDLLAPILCYADLLARREPEGGELSREGREIRQAAERAATLATQLLSIAELTAETPADVEINRIVEHMSDVLARQAGERVELATRLEEGLGRIHVDADRLERLLMNVVLNARDAMPNGGRVFIETSHVRRAHRAAGEAGVTPKRYVTLAISDSGLGMDAAGTGHGLATALAFARRNHGYVDVESEPGCGTTFRIGFPEVTEASMPANPRLD